MPKNKFVRLVIDTNLWISFIISKKIHHIDKLFLEHKIKLLFSLELVEEIKATMQKPKLEKYFNSNSMGDLLEILDSFIEMIDVKSNVLVCRDDKDNFLLSLAIDGKADFLLTGDKDLLILNKFEKTKIVTMTEFIELINS